tara:strand:+ start:3066 stop:3512 length:447 start_codon:yes stop_codon:yes gene_type:complete
MNYQEKNEIKKASNILIASNDHRFNYQFTKKPETLEKLIEAGETPMMIPMNKYDYSLKVNDGDDYTLPNLCPLSLASCSNNLEDMEAFYAAKFPRLPSEYHGILARYSSGQLITKKEIKNTIKKSKKKNKDLPVGFSVAKKDISLNFD